MGYTLRADVAYFFPEIERILAAIDTEQGELNNTIEDMKSKASAKLVNDSGEFKEAYNDYVTKFEAEKNKLYDYLDDIQKGFRDHIAYMRERQGQAAAGIRNAAGLA